MLRRRRDTIKRYLNTNVPYKNYLFYTKVLHDFDLINNLICKAKKGLDLNKTLPKKVLVYSVSGEMLQFDSKEEAARFLNVQARTITNHIDKWIKGGINGYYLFSQELNNIEKQKLLKVSSLRKTNNWPEERFGFMMLIIYNQFMVHLIACKKLPTTLI